ncbi:hypothetical protein ACODT3_40735 [Streptomyces sp. 4.24]|uniref:hypothetical protein n=1 Tax=Streptomyces tritrimontium TaxID=3406573 RepID=UPI003BB80709
MKFSVHSRRGLLAATAIFVACTSTSALASTGANLTPQAFDASGKPLAIRTALESCRSQPGACSFKIDPEGAEQFYTSVKSMGNAVINCTKKDITVTRKLNLTTNTVDNIGGSISGSGEASGNVSVSADASTSSNSSSEGSFTSPNFEQGPTSTSAGTSQSGNSATTAGSQGASAAFAAAFSAYYDHSWMREQTEETKYEVTVAPGDALVFGASHAMQRVNGTLTTSNGTVRNITVDGPSTVNTSTFVAETFTAPADACRRLRPQTQPEATPPTRAGNEISQLPKGSHLKSRETIHATKKTATKPNKK